MENGEMYDLIKFESDEYAYDGHVESWRILFGTKTAAEKYAGENSLRVVEECKNPETDCVLLERKVIY